MKPAHAVPQHVAIVMDGNGRWAKARHLPRAAGHRAGAKAVRRAIEYCVEKKIPVLSLFALSVENLKHRPSTEVKLLIGLLLDSLIKNTHELHESNIRIDIIGDRLALDEKLQQQIQLSEEKTKHNTGLTLILAINYSGQWDILQAAQKVVELKKTQPQALLDEAFFEKQLSFHHLPNPDLLIRTSGEQRISNFMLWQLAYTELYFSPVYWPDFDATCFQAALDFYGARQRRFGLTSEQIECHDA